jgi:solute carrier family 25, member 39/40
MVRLAVAASWQNTRDLLIKDLFYLIIHLTPTIVTVSMDAFQAKLVAAATGSALTAITSMFYFYYWLATTLTFQPVTPFDVVKTRLQTQPPQTRLLFPRPPSNTCCQPSNGAQCARNMSSLVKPIATDVVCLWEGGLLKTERVNGVYDALRHVWRAEGVRGLWKGVGTSLLVTIFFLFSYLLIDYFSVIGVPSSTAYILAYDHLLNVVLPPFIRWETVVPLVAGMSARTAITSIASPLELIRTNLQSTPLSPENPHTMRSVLSSIRNLIRENGFQVMWRGLGPSLWRDVPFSGFYWASYETWKRAFKKHGHEGALVAFICGAISGTSAALVTSPFDVLKTRRQAVVMSSLSENASTSTFPFLLRIFRTEGPSAFFAGIIPRIAKIAPACGIMIASFEVFIFTFGYSDAPTDFHTFRVSVNS